MVVGRALVEPAALLARVTDGRARGGERRGRGRELLGVVGERPAPLRGGAVARELAAVRRPLRRGLEALPVTVEALLAIADDHVVDDGDVRTELVPIRPDFATRRAREYVLGLLREDEEPVEEVRRVEERDDDDERRGDAVEVGRDRVHLLRVEPVEREADGRARVRVVVARRRRVPRANLVQRAKKVVPVRNLSLPVHGRAR